jgi:site-specific DNA-methyltransferase (adenine-specific)
VNPYFSDGKISLYLGDCREIAPQLDRVDLVLTDPPYGQTSLKWDRWVDGWPSIALTLAPVLWCFGSFRMFVDRWKDFDCWKMSQEIVWEKHNGSSCANDRFRRKHELAVHFYDPALKWKEIYKKPVTTPDAVAKTVRRKERPPHWGKIESSTYTSQDGGPRLMSSVIRHRSCHGYAIAPTQKPEGLLHPLIEYACPEGGTLVDLFAGSGSSLRAARFMGRRAIGIESDEAMCEKAAISLSSTVEFLT